jgi:hypothetical protein
LEEISSSVSSKVQKQGPIKDTEYQPRIDFKLEDPRNASDMRLHVTA